MSFLAGLFAGPVGESNDVGSDSFWGLRAFGSQTHAGMPVDQHNALELTVVYSAIGILSDGEAQLPMDVGQKVGGRRIQRDDNHLDWVLNVRANPFMSAFTARNLLMSHALGWGNGYAEIQRNRNGEPRALWPLLPDRTWPEVVNGRLIYRTRIAGKVETLDSSSVLHVPALGFDGIRGYSPLYIARNSIGLGKAAEAYGSKFFANDAKSGGFIHHPGELGPKATKNLEESVNRPSGLEHHHRIKVLEEGAKFVSTTIPPEDAQFLETRRFQVEEIARLYRVPLFMLQSNSKDTSWGTGIGQMSLGFLQYTLAPWLIRLEQEMREKLLTQDEREDGLYIKHNVAGLLRGDTKARAEYYTAALNPVTGWMKRNEVRPLEDLDQLDDGEWDESEDVA